MVAMAVEFLGCLRIRFHEPFDSAVTCECALLYNMQVGVNAKYKVIEVIYGG